MRSIRKLEWRYTWVKAHMDEVLPWADLTRPQQLNVMCNAHTKQVVNRILYWSDGDPVAPMCQLLPLENCTVFIDGVKQTADPVNRLCYSCGKHQAKLFLTSEIC